MGVVRARVRSAKAFALLLSAVAILGVAVGVAAQDEGDKGEAIQNSACLGCHDLRPIQTVAYDKDRWTQVVDAMIQKGADVKDADRPVLIDFLTKNHGPLPSGPGQTILLNVCTVCHDLSRVKAHRVSPEEWEETLNSMLNEGAMLSDQDFPVLLNYLAKNFR